MAAGSGRFGRGGILFDAVFSAVVGVVDVSDPFGSGHIDDYGGFWLPLLANLAARCAAVVCLIRRLGRLVRCLVFFCSTARVLCI